jgi:hypothetical protein
MQLVSYELDEPKRHEKDRKDFLQARSSKHISSDGQFIRHFLRRDVHRKLM